MSIIRCVVCDKNIDSDFIEIAETENGAICINCETEQDLDISELKAKAIIKTFKLAERDLKDE